MSQNILKHPTFTNKDDIASICMPITKLGITYFCHVNINEEGQFSGLSNNPEFSEHYIKNQYYNADIHLVDDKLGNFVLWDALPKCGETKKMDDEAGEFGVKHTFTIVKTNKNTKDFYHFATHLNNDCFNQVYLSNLEALNNFIEFFNDKTRCSKLLLSAYNYRFTPNQGVSKFCLADIEEYFSLERKQVGLTKVFNEQNESIILHKESGKIVTLAPQQMRCLVLLLLGKTSKEIGMELGLSYRSVEHYIQRIRKILGCRNSKELLAEFSITSYTGIMK